jgi:hypothetical protein
VALMDHHRSFAKSGGNAIRQSSATLPGARRSTAHDEAARDPVIWCRAVDDVIPTLSCKMIPKASRD